MLTAVKAIAAALAIAIGWMAGKALGTGRTTRPFGLPYPRPLSATELRDLRRLLRQGEATKRTDWTGPK